MSSVWDFLEKYKVLGCIILFAYGVVECFFGLKFFD